MSVLRDILRAMFGGARPAAEPVEGPGVRRAAARHAARLAAEAARCADDPGEVVTRQQVRAWQRRSAKMPSGVSMPEWHQRRGFKDVHGRGRRGA